MPKPSAELAGILDEVKATILAVLAGLQEKEKQLRDHTAEEVPPPGVSRGLSDIGALRRWADRTLRTIGVLEQGASGELHALLDELGEFREIVSK